MKTIYYPILDKQMELIKANQHHNSLVSSFNKTLKEQKINPDTVDFTFGNYPELRNWLINNKLDPDTLPQSQKLINIFSDDFTFEKLKKMIAENNEHSFLIRADEILGTFKTFNQYKKGGGNDEETLLKLWDYAPIKCDRMGDDNCFYINNPTVSLFGATQKEMLFEMFSDHRIKNGSVFRFLFSVDDSVLTKNPFIEESDFSKDNILKSFLDDNLLRILTTENKRQILKMEDGCKKFVGDWREKCNTHYTKIIEVETFNSIMGKMDSYILRIAIILNRLCCHYENLTENIRVIDLENASKIIDYYIREIIDVLEYTMIYHRRFLKNQNEIDFYENYISQSIPYFELIKGMEVCLYYTQKQAYNTFFQWLHNGIIKRNSKGIIYKVIK